MPALLCRGDCFATPLVYRIGFVSFVKFLSGDCRNPSRGEGEDVRLSARTSKYTLVLAFDYISLKSTPFISCIATIVHLYVLDAVCVLILFIIQASQLL